MINLRFSGFSQLASAIENEITLRNREAFNIFKYYSAEVVKYFFRVQGNLPAEVKGQFWTNHTFKAAKSFFAQAYELENNRTGLIMDYDTSLAPYVKYLEFYYGERFAALPALIDKFYPMIMHDLKVLYGEI